MDSRGATGGLPGLRRDLPARQQSLALVLPQRRPLRDRPGVQHLHDEPVRQQPLRHPGQQVHRRRPHLGAPTTLIDDPNPYVENDKETVTADPKNPNDVYVVWDRISLDPVTGVLDGPTYFSRTTNGGRTWEPARPTYDPGPGTQTVDNQIVVLPNGTLVDVFVQGSPGGLSGSVELIRSTDHGATWSSPVPVATGTVLPVTDPDTGASVRSASELPEVTTDPTTGAIDLVLQSVSFTGGPTIHGITFLMSNDGGMHWSAPIKINRTPTDIPAADQQAFDPMISVAANGTVAVTYYDFRNNTPAPGCRPTPGPSSPTRRTRRTSRVG